MVSAGERYVQGRKEQASETERVTTGGTLWPVRDYPGFILLLELQQKKRLGWLLTDASGLADFPVRKILYPIGCSKTATDASIIHGRRNSYHYQA